MRFLKIIFFMLLASVGAALVPFTALATNYLANGGFNNPFNDIPSRIWHEQPEKIAAGWNYFYINANTEPGSGNASKLHWMSSAQFGQAFGGLDYHIEGDQSQVMWSSYKFDSGVYQQVGGLTPGQGYKFFIKMTTYWRGPGYPDTNGVMVKQVGIDPYGGVDPTSPTVVWGPADADDKAWVGMVAAATAETTTMTVFAKVQAPENDSYKHTDLDMVYFEDARLEILTPPTTTLNGTNNGITVQLTWSGSNAPGWTLKGYEVQYKDQAGGDWITLQDKTGLNTSASFSGQAAHTYLGRARAWQTTSGLDMPGQWVETSVTIKDVVAGRVTDHAGIGLTGVSIAVSSAPTTTISQGGYYGLATGPGAFGVAASDWHGLAAPPAATVTVPPNGIGALDITLRPTGAAQGIVNNDFETDLSGWSVSPNTAAGLSTATGHSGQHSLRLFGPVSVSQTGAVAGMARPLLSFWYKNDAPFTVEFLAEGMGTTEVRPAQTRVLPLVSDWTFFTLDLGGSELYTGTLGVNFNYSNSANIFIDEVSIATGPLKTYLPVIFK